MTKFTDGYRQLVSDFQSRRIPTKSPGFCDHPNFLAAEREDPSFLNNYAAFIAAQPYSDEYLHHARAVITNASSILYEELKVNGRLGACVDVSGILSRILEKEGIWNCGIKGSLTISFPPSSGEEKTYFWSVDHGEFVAGHAWLFAPPFSIVDVAVKQQPYSGRKADYLPNINLIESASTAGVEIEDIISPSAIAELRMHGVPRSRYFEAVASQMSDILKVFPAQSVETSNGSFMKYCPVAIHASDTPLEDMRNMEFGGKTPYQLYKEKFLGAL